MAYSTVSSTSSKQKKESHDNNISPSLKRWMKKQGRMDHRMKWLFVGSASLVSIIIFSIILFVGFQGVQVFRDISLAEFFFSADWAPSASEPRHGAFAFIYSTLLLTLLSIGLAVPLAVSGAVFMAKIAPKWMRELLRPAADLFVGIPSVVYGLIGLTVIVPWMGRTFGGPGYGLLPAAVILAVMILPTIMSITEDAIRSLPTRLEEASLALGATRWQTIWRVLIPASGPGIITGIILGMGRAIGETMAVFMVIGNSVTVPGSLLESTTVLTTAIVKDMGNTFYGTTWSNALYMMAFLLLIISLLLILIIRIIARRSENS